jgi:predicted metal-dependent phosphoesterase TrpH
VKVDLHLHSSASDGTETPGDLILAAGEAGVGVLALTDHDTFDGLDEAAAAAANLGIRLLRGVELSVDHGESKLHLLVYFFDDTTTKFERSLATLREGRHERNAAIVAALNDLGYGITLDDVHRHAKGPSVGRPHIADALVEKEYFSGRSEVFEHLLHDGGPAYVERGRMTAVEAIDLARSCGAVPVVAHPATITIPTDGYASFFSSLWEIGLGGIEAHHPMHTPALRGQLTAMAHRFGIAATGGSDYHGVDKRDYRIGVGRGDLAVPLSAIDELEAQRAR